MKECLGCGGCCTTMRFELYNEDHKRWAELHGVKTVYDEVIGAWCVEFDIPCQKLGEDKMCTIYRDRPKLCRDYICEEKIKELGKVADNAQ